MRKERLFIGGSEADVLPQRKSECYHGAYLNMWRDFFALLTRRLLLIRQRPRKGRTVVIDIVERRERIPSIAVGHAGLGELEMRLRMLYRGGGVLIVHPGDRHALRVRKVRGKRV